MKYDLEFFGPEEIEKYYNCSNSYQIMFSKPRNWKIVKNTWVKDNISFSKELKFNAKSQGGNFMPKKVF